MPVLFYADMPYMVMSGDVDMKLAQGFSRTPLTPRKSATPTVAPPVAGLLNVNECSIAELTAIKGIGITTANEIINGRPYAAVEELAGDTRLVPHLSKFTV